MIPSPRQAVPPALAVAAVLSLALALAGCSGSSGGGSPVPPSTATTPSNVPSKVPSKGSTKPPPVATGKPSVAISSAPPVRVGSSSAFRRGVDVRVSRVRSVTLKANGPGEIAGAGVSVSLTVTNSSGASFDLGGVVVNASYGQDQPASPGSGSAARPLAGTLKNGATASGSYLFSVPKAQVGSVKIQVESDSSPLILSFEN